MKALMDIPEIRTALDEQFAPLEPDVTGLRLLPGKNGEAELKLLEEELELRLSDSFRRSILDYDFGHLTIGPIPFGYETDYLANLRLWNLGDEVAWWGPQSERPRSLILIAMGDPFALLLDCESGAVRAFLPEEAWTQAHKVAEDFDAFLRGVGSVMLKRDPNGDNRALADFVARAVGSEHSPFWEFLAE